MKVTCKSLIGCSSYECQGLINEDAIGFELGTTENRLFYVHTPLIQYAINYYETSFKLTQLLSYQ